MEVAFTVSKARLMSRSDPNAPVIGLALEHVTDNIVCHEDRLQTGVLSHTGRLQGFLMSVIYRHENFDG